MRVFFLHIKQVDSMLPDICLVIDHTICQNVVKTSVYMYTHLMAHVPLLFLPHY